VTFIAEDPLQSSTSISVKITVTPVNDPPVMKEIPHQTVAEGDSFTVIDLDKYVADVDNGIVNSAGRSHRAHILILS
jgi:hypothetical protein